MKNYITFAVVLAVFTTLFAYIPKSKAPVPLEKNELQALIMRPAAPVSTFTPINSSAPQKDTLLSLLELTVDKDRDLSKGLDIIDSTTPTAINQKILQLYEAKITSRALDFGKAQQLLQGIDDPELAILKAAVMIANSDRDKTGAYLHDLAENNPDAMIKSQALALLDVYYRYDRHRDVDESYLWTLFAQKLGDWGEFEISKYLAEKALQRSHEYRDAWIIKAFDELSLKNPSDAELSLLTAYRLDPGNSHIQYLLGLAYFDLGKSSQSNQFLLYAKENGEAYHDVINEKLAENAIKTEDFPLAAHYYETLLEESPKNENALTRLTWIYTEKLQQLDKATATAEQLVKYFPNHSSNLDLLNALKAIKNEPVKTPIG